MSTLCAERIVDMKELTKIETPKATKSWNPVPHDFLVNSVLEQIEKMEGWKLASDPEIGLSHGGARCFFLMNLLAEGSDHCLSIGGRNAHDKEFALALFGGASVFICSNLQAFGEYDMKTKHTSQVFDRLPDFINNNLNNIKIDGLVNDERIDFYKDYEIESDTIIHDCVIKSIDKGVIPTQSIPRVLNEWRTPRHEEFSPRTMWSLNNCYTEVFKEYKNPEQVNSRSISLTKVMDEWTLFDPKEVRARIVEAEAKEEVINIEPPVIINTVNADPVVPDEDGSFEVVSDKELQKIFDETRNLEAKPVKQTKSKAKKEKKKGKGLDEILTNLAKERKAKNPTLLKKRK